MLSSAAGMRIRGTREILLRSTMATATVHGVLHVSQVEKGQQTWLGPGVIVVSCLYVTRT